ncbi:rRNA maturation RNase YbeY [Patescibacteria group bacterium]|nr:rRNA maturation RNase YbeY [Patescibacteria group bacterium]
MVEIQNSTKERIRVKQLKTLAERILKKEKSGKKDLSAVLVSPQKMRELNKVWRGKDKATNVLAFPGGKEALGEVVLCPSAIRKDALEYKISFQRAVSWMFVHGLLHLLGYDHKTSNDEKKMTQKEQRYLS